MTARIARIRRLSIRTSGRGPTGLHREVIRARPPAAMTQGRNDGTQAFPDTPGWPIFTAESFNPEALHMQMRKLIVEAIGTFFLVLTIGQVVIDPGAGAMGPLVIGGILMVMV